MLPSKEIEKLARENPNELVKKLGGGTFSGYGTGVSPVPPGVPIVDNKYTRDAARPIDQKED